MNNIISRSIELLRFPLILAVIFIHPMSVVTDNYKYLEMVKNLLSNTICHIAVPIFFIISGYLFFINIKEFSFSIYVKKISSRFWTLFIPYIFWNLIFILFIALGQILLPSLFTGSFKAVKDFSVFEWISMFWTAMGSGEPISFQFWFLRDLIVMVIISPFFYILGSYGRWGWIAILVLLRLSGWEIGIPGLSSVAISFFGIGSTLSIMRFEKTKMPKYVFTILSVVYIMIILIEQFNMDASWHDFIHRFDTLLGCILVFQISFFIAKREISNKYLIQLSKCSFFIYCYHVLFLLIVSRLLKFLPIWNNELSLILLYLLTPVIVVFLGVCIYNILERFMPHFLKLISGGR